MLRLVLLLLLAGCASSGAGDAVDPGDVANESVADAKEACEAWNPRADLDPATAEPCEPEGATWRACTVGGVSGFQRCTYVETGEDTGVHRWGLCDQACTADQVGTTRACQVNGTPGIHYCAEIYGVEVPLWRDCLLPQCLACTPGDTKLCGPGTNYPDTLMKCILSDGVPVWFDGDCTT